jgi:hypothetical protein
MAKKDEKPKRVKITKVFRFMPDTDRRLKAAVNKTGLSETAYVELALKAQLRKDGIE